MARTSTTRSFTVRPEIHRYFWPSPILNLWQLVMLAAAGVQIGVYAQFMNIQNKFHVGIPWLFPFSIATGSLLAVFVIFIVVYSIVNKLIPFPVIVGSFVLFVLFLTGLIETSVQLFGAGNVHSNCQTYIVGRNLEGISQLELLAWFEESSICSAWYASFSFWLIGLVFLAWMIGIAISVNQRSYVDN